MKKAILILLSLLIIFSLTSCGFESTKQYESRMEEEAESLKAIQNSEEESSAIETSSEVTSNTGTTTIATEKSPSSSNQQSTTANVDNNVAATSQTTNTATTQATITVNLTVKCNKALTHPLLKTSATLPTDGIMLNTVITVNEGSSVLEVMNAAQSLNYLTFTTGNLMSGYINSINQLYEKSCGTRSGWKYRINETYPINPKDVTVKAGDNIVWFYAITENDIDN